MSLFGSWQSKQRPAIRVTDPERDNGGEVFKKYKSKSAIELVQMLPDILSLVTTDLSKKDMMRYIGAILTIRAKKLETMSIPIKGGYTSNKMNGMSVLVPDLVVNQEELHTFLFGD